MISGVSVRPGLHGTVLVGFRPGLYVLRIVANKNAVERSPAMKRSIRSAKAKRAGVQGANIELLHRSYEDDLVNP